MIGALCIQMLVSMPRHLVIARTMIWWSISSLSVIERLLPITLHWLISRKDHKEEKGENYMERTGVTMREGTHAPEQARARLRCR